MKNILVVLNVQNDFISGSLGSTEAKNVIPKIINKIHTFHGLVIAVLDTHNENYLSTKDGGYFPIHCIDGTYGWKLQKDVEDIIKSKQHYDNYTTSSLCCIDLVEDLKDEFYSRYSTDINIELIGFFTDTSIIATALLLKAYMPEAQITVDTSCCIGNSYDLQNHALDILRSCHITIMDELR